MIITFKVFKEKIESGEKTTTIREYNEGQFNKFANTYLNKKKLQLYWHNPRNGGKLIKEADMAGLPDKLQFCKQDSPVGKNLQIHRNLQFIKNVATNEKLPLFELAKTEGFKNDSEMWDWFWLEYYTQMYEKKFMLIRWLP